MFAGGSAAGSPMRRACARRKIVPARRKRLRRAIAKTARMEMPDRKRKTKKKNSFSESVRS